MCVKLLSQGYVGNVCSKLESLPYSVMQSDGNNFWAIFNKASKDEDEILDHFIASLQLIAFITKDTCIGQ